MAKGYIPIKELIEQVRTRYFAIKHIISPAFPDEEIAK